MKIRQGEDIIKVQLADCYLTQAEAAAITGQKAQNYKQYVLTNEVRLVPHSIDGDSMYSLKEVAEDARRFVAEQIQTDCDAEVKRLQKEIDELQQKLAKGKREFQILKATAAARTEKAEPTPTDRQKLQDELLQGEVDLNRARLRKFNLTNEKIILQLKELCKQELVEVIQPIIARLDQALSPHAEEVHLILNEMLLKLQSEVVFTEITEDDKSLINEAKENIDDEKK